MTQIPQTAWPHSLLSVNSQHSKHTSSNLLCKFRCICFFFLSGVCVFLSLPYNVKKRKVWKQEQMCEKVIKTHICTCICHCQLESKLQIDYGVQKIWWHILHVFLSLHSVLAEHLPNLTVIALCIRFHQQGHGRIFEYIHSVDKIHTKRWLYLVTHHWLNLTYNEVLLIVQVVG